MASWDHLFAVPPSDFVEARKALVKQLRAAGKDKDSRQVAGLRKPSAALWVVNQLSRRAPDLVNALVEATQRMKRAHEEGAGEELRDAMREQHEVAQAIRRAAEEAAREIGADASPGLLRRVQETAQAAAVSDPAALRAGTLTEELGPSGFDALAGTKVAAPPPSRGPLGAAPAAPEAPTATSEDPKRRRQEQQVAERAKKRETQRAAKELNEAEHTARELSALAEKADHRARRARKDADDAQEEAVAARSRADEAAERASALRKKRDAF
jgi:hypothetical protein